MLKGVAASRGVFSGPVQVLGLPSGAPAFERVFESHEQRFAHALQRARAALAATAGQSGRQGRDVLDIQLELLDDHALTDPVWQRLSQGSDAEAAWTESIDERIACFENDDDEQFRTRAADLHDLKDRVLFLLRGVQREAIRAGTVVVADELAPSHFLETNWSCGGAVVLTRGSAFSHVAMLARAQGVPMVVGLGLQGVSFADATVDGTHGVVHAGRIDGFLRHSLAASDSQPQIPLSARSGRRIELMINVARLADLDHIEVDSCDGIGLVRTEFLFSAQGANTSEADQISQYQALSHWARGKAVHIRVFDAAADKPVAGLTGRARGTELLLQHEELFKIQLRSILAAAPGNDIRILLPMITSRDQVMRVRQLLLLAVQELAWEGRAVRLPMLGVMLETAAALQSRDIMEAADYVSVGSNDLMRELAAGHTAAQDGLHALLIDMIGRAVELANAVEKPMMLCGEIAGEAAHTDAVLATGLRCLSVSANQLRTVAQATVAC